MWCGCYRYPLVRLTERTFSRSISLYNEYWLEGLAGKSLTFIQVHCLPDSIIDSWIDSIKCWHFFFRSFYAEVVEWGRRYKVSAVSDRLILICLEYSLTAVRCIEMTFVSIIKIYKYHTMQIRMILKSTLWLFSSVVVMIEVRGSCHSSSKNILTLRTSYRYVTCLYQMPLKIVLMY